MTSTRRIPISKKCGLCKTIKLLNEFEIDEQKKDRHAEICKECMAKHQGPSICSCSCDKCIDGKIKTAFSSMELLVTWIENGLELSEDMLMVCLMTSSLISFLNAG